VITPLLRVVAAALALAPGSAVAQILGAPPGGSSRPALFASGSIGIAQIQNVDDGRTGAIWDFGTGFVYRASLEYDLGNATSIGVQVGRSRMPLRYAAFESNSAPPPCNIDCDAHANISTIMAVFRASGEVGFNQVIEIGAGFTRYEKFTEDATGTPLAPTFDTDLSFSLGFGFEYSFRPWAQMFLIQDGTIAIHQRDLLPGNANSVYQHYYTRLGLRLGAGRR
jgi:hypothetical protein